MNRKIIFRGRDKHGKWRYGDLYTDCNGDACIHSQRHEPYETSIFPVIPETVGQFVGITDEYGTEVYEGDILEADYKYDRIGARGGVDPDNDCMCYGVVEFDNDVLQWCLNIYKAEYPISKQIKEDECSIFSLHIFGHEYGYDNPQIKVIGNIHEPDISAILKESGEGIDELPNCLANELLRMKGGEDD